MFLNIWCALFVLFIFVKTTQGKFVSNLSPVCIRCLCHASSSCNLLQGCSQGYCGPFFMNKEYWRDAGRVTITDDDDPEREQAFADCARDYNCAQKIVENYMAKYGLDCNGDDVTDCDDYAQLHFHGRTDCSQSVEGTNYGIRYMTCRPVPIVVNNSSVS